MLNWIFYSSCPSLRPKYSMKRFKLIFPVLACPPGPFHCNPPHPHPPSSARLSTYFFLPPSRSLFYGWASLPSFFFYFPLRPGKRQSAVKKFALKQSKEAAEEENNVRGPELDLASRKLGRRWSFASFFSLLALFLPPPFPDFYFPDFIFASSFHSVPLAGLEVLLAMINRFFSSLYCRKIWKVCLGQRWEDALKELPGKTWSVAKRNFTESF